MRVADPVEEAPTLGTPKPIALPTFDESELANGLLLLLNEDHRTPYVTVTLVVPAGTVRDRVVGDLVAESLTRGSQSRSKQQLDETMTAKGRSLAAWTSATHTTVQAWVLPADLDVAMEVVSDVTRRPAFAKDEVRRVKETAKAAQRERATSPLDAAAALLRQSLHVAPHPSAVAIARPEEVDRVTRRDLQSFHDTHYRPDGSVLIISGDFDPGQAQALTGRYFADWSAKRPALPVVDLPKPHLESGPVIHVMDLATDQVTIYLGWPVPTLEDPEGPAIQAVARVLGGDIHARLGADLRERRGLAYVVESYVKDGIFHVVAQTHVSTLQPMLEGMRSHLRAIGSDNPPNADELRSAVAQLRWEFVRERETAEQIGDRVAASEGVGLAWKKWPDYLEALDALTLDALAAAAARHIFDQPSIALVGPRDAITEVMKKVWPQARIIEYDDALRPEATR